MMRHMCSYGIYMYGSRSIYIHVCMALAATWYVYRTTIWYVWLSQPHIDAQNSQLPAARVGSTTRDHEQVTPPGSRAVYTLVSLHGCPNGSTPTRLCLLPICYMPCA